MVYFSLTPTALNENQRTVVTIQCELDKLAFCTDLQCTLILPSDIIALGGNKRPFSWGLLNKDQPQSQSVKLLATQMGTFTLWIADIEYTSCGSQTRQSNIPLTLDVIQPETPPEASSSNTISDSTPTSPMHLVILFDKMRQTFDLNELRRLCFRLGIAHDNISGNTRDDFAQSLVSYSERRGLLFQLKELCQQERPHIDW